MASPTKKTAGSYYSGANPVPNIHKFMESLDAENKTRDDQINRDMKERRKKGKLVSHDEPTGMTGSRKVVTDPTTGGEVQIEDVNTEFLSSVANPTVSNILPNIAICVFDFELQLSVPNANLNKPTEVRTQAAQTGEEYRYIKTLLPLLIRYVRYTLSMNSDIVSLL